MFSITTMLRRGVRRVHFSSRKSSTPVSTKAFGQGQSDKDFNFTRSPQVLTQRSLKVPEPVFRTGADADTYKRTGRRSFSRSLYTDSISSVIITDDESLDSEGMPVKLGLELPGLVVPQLPEIEDDAIQLQVFTHRSLYALPTHIFEDEPGKPAPDNERLEHLGDAVLQLAVTQLLQEFYPCLRVGPATKIRSLAVGNGTLADIAMKYGLHQRLRLHHAQAITLKNSVHIRADVFEAYVGGLFLDQGLEVVKEWLYTLFEPYIREAYRVVRNQHGLPPVEAQPVSPSVSHLCDQNGHIAQSRPSPPSPTNSYAASGGHLSLFNQFMQQQRKTIEWIYSSDRGPGTKTTPIWRVRAMLDGECIAEGRGSTKKAAQNDAARVGLEGLDVVINERLPRA